MIRRALPFVIGILCIAAAGVGAIAWLTFRVYVPEDKCAVLIRKMGERLPPGQVVATEPGQQGIQEEVLGPGHPDTIRCMENLAACYTAMGNEAAAKEMQERATRAGEGNLSGDDGTP